MVVVHCTTRLLHHQMSQPGRRLVWRAGQVNTSLNLTVTSTEHTTASPVVSGLVSHNLTDAKTPSCLLMFSYLPIELWLLFRFLLATRPSGVKGLMLAIFGFSDTEVESHSWMSAFKKLPIGNEDLLGSPSTSK